MIIVEGPDGAGKTTLVNELCNNLRYRKGTRSVANREDLFKVTRKDTYGSLAMAISGVNPVLVWDRMFFSELVYYEWTTGKCQFSEREQQYIYKVLEAMNVPIIVCLPPLETVQKNLAASEKEQTHYAVEHCNKIYQSYKHMRFPMQTVYFDYTSPRSHEMMQRVYQSIANYMNVKEERMV